MKKFLLAAVCCLILPVFLLTGCFATQQNHEFDTQNQLILNTAQSNNELLHLLEEHMEEESRKQNKPTYEKVVGAIGQTNTYLSMLVLMNGMIESYERTGVTTLRLEDGVYKYTSGETSLTLERSQEKFVLKATHDGAVDQLVLTFTSDKKNYSAELTGADGLIFIADFFGIDMGYAFQCAVMQDNGYFSISQAKYVIKDQQVSKYNLFVYESQSRPQTIVNGVLEGFAEGQGSVFGQRQVA